MATARSQAKNFTEILKKIFGERLVSVVLFGSVARKTNNPESDIDLLVVIHDLPPGRLKRREIFDPALISAQKLKLNATFNCHLKTPEEARHVTVMYFDIALEGLILHDQNHFFSHVLQHVHQIMKNNGSKRIQMGSYYYWDLKPSAKPGEVFNIT